MHHLSLMPRREGTLHARPSGCQGLVRFFALLRIKPHAPPLVRVPVNSFEFHSCERTPQAEYLLRLLRHRRAVPADTWYSSFTAWTTRVSNPVCSPRFRASASVVVQQAAFATGVPPNIYAFHRYTRNSACPSDTPARQFPVQSRGWAPGFHTGLAVPPALPLRPVNPDNARPLRITAAAGT